ncbi:MAG: AAA family ATPase, partial [Bacteroidales bacterium]|nr:AAA family ATPase [Bacteroidales bacterium]
MAFEPTIAQKTIYEFVEHGVGNGIIDAVAGAGKTSTLMGCVEHIPNINDVLYCAFNTSIRKEIQKKFHERGKSVAVKTIHGLGFQIIRSF